jgi:hypothetical protein
MHVTRKVLTAVAGSAMALAIGIGPASAAATQGGAARSVTAATTAQTKQAPRLSALQAQASGNSSSTQAAKPQGDSPWEGCDPTYFCFWVNAFYGGDMGVFQGDNPVWGDYADAECQTGTWSNCASSAINNGTSGDAVEMYEGNYYTGESWCVPDNSAVADFAGFTYENGDQLNDSVNSNLWVLPQDCGYSGQ